MSQLQFFWAALALVAALTAFAIIFVPPHRGEVEQCRAAGGELVVVRAGKPVCIRRDALIELP